jgi:uncharacterized membrane protein YdjX (TVP38/TMEM64 family)
VQPARFGHKLSRFFSAVAFPAVVLGILLAVFLLREDLTAIFSSPERVEAWIEQVGMAGAIAFVLVQFVQVVIFVIPGEVVQIAGGYLFGTVFGVLYSLIGISAGSLFNFFLARLLGVPFVEAVFPEKHVEQFRRVAESPKAKIGFFLFFLIPGIPKDILCYVAGVSPLGPVAFFVISMTGRLPALVGSNIIGEAASAQQWPLAIGIFAASVVLFGLGFFYRHRLQELVERVSRR